MSRVNEYDPSIDEEVRTIRKTIAPAVIEALEFLADKYRDTNLAYVKVVSALLMTAADSASAMITKADQPDFDTPRRREVFKRLLEAWYVPLNEEVQR